MNVDISSENKISMMKLFFYFIMTFLLGSSVAFSAEVVITAEFMPDISSPSNNKFKNTTPKSGFCNRYPGNCSGDVFAIAVNGIEASKLFDSASNDLQGNHPYYAVDGREKKFKIKNKKTGFETEVSFRVSIFSVRTTRKNSADGSIWGPLQPSAYPAGGCRTLNSGSGQAAAFSFGWGVPNERLECYRKMNPSFTGEARIHEFSVGYEFNAGKPLEIPPGVYEGEVVYTVGDGMDFDFFAYNYTDNQMVVKIKATVQHAFFYRFPAGSENVQLSPPNGWSSWINGGMIPQKLSKEVPFTLSSSSGFKVWMQCEHNSGAGCGLKNQATAETVPLDVKMTIPGFTSSRQPVRNMLLNTDAAGHTIDLPGQFVVDLRSKLDFVVNRPEVEKMVKAPGSSWKGAVTLIFDSEVE